MTYKFEGKYGGTLALCQKCGMGDVIFLSWTVSSLLYEFIHKQCFHDGIIKLAVNLIAEGNESIEYDPVICFSVDDFAIEKQLSMMPS